MRDDAIRERGGWPVRLGDVMGGALERVGPKGLWTEAQLRRVWERVVGEQVAAHTRVVRLRGDVLEVRTTDPSWATELRYLSQVVVGKLNAAVGAGTVRELLVRTDRAGPR